MGPPTNATGRFASDCCRCRFLRAQHHAEYTLHGHGVAAHTPLLKKVALAVPNPAVVPNFVSLMLSMELDFKTPEADPLRLFRVLTRFADLGDHRRIHKEASSINLGWCPSFV
ncbi:MAG: hypothetical protein HGA86_08570 [Anaerolineaceae bacterium]|nr:hypothetical protein [Anaerolineaceae bacterium]